MSQKVYPFPLPVMTTQHRFKDANNVNHILKNKTTVLNGISFDFMINSIQVKNVS